MVRKRVRKVAKKAPKKTPKKVAKKTANKKNPKNKAVRKRTPKGGKKVPKKKLPKKVADGPRRHGKLLPNLDGAYEIGSHQSHESKEENLKRKPFRRIYETPTSDDPPRRIATLLEGIKHTDREIMRLEAEVRKSTTDHREPAPRDEDPASEFSGLNFNGPIDPERAQRLLDLAESQSRELKRLQNEVDHLEHANAGLDMKLTEIEGEWSKTLLDEKEKNEALTKKLAMTRAALSSMTESMHRTTRSLLEVEVSIEGKVEIG